MIREINKLSTQSIFIGTSSWKYEGWKGLIYHKPYTSQKQFNEGTLHEYAEHFSAVGVDHTYYSWPNKGSLEKYFDETPDSFKFILKATDQITVPRFPKIARYGKNAGCNNLTFLDAECFAKNFLEPVSYLKHKLGAIVLEFSRFQAGTIQSGSEFVEKLDFFLEQICKVTSHRIAVEIRNGNWLKPAYFSVLKRHSVSPVFNSWTHMPEIGAQWELTKPFDFSCSVIRLLLKPGVLYADAVDRFSPYDRIQEVQSTTRMSVVNMIREALALKKHLFLLVNNRFEGCAPKTIEGILKELSNQD